MQCSTSEKSFSDGRFSLGWESVWTHCSNFMREHFKGLMFDCHKYCKLKGQRSHECERGTQECVRHTTNGYS